MLIINHIKVEQNDYDLMAEYIDTLKDVDIDYDFKIKEHDKFIKSYSVLENISVNLSIP